MEDHGDTLRSGGIGLQFRRRGVFEKIPLANLGQQHRTRSGVEEVGTFLARTLTSEWLVKIATYIALQLNLPRFRMFDWE